MMKILFYCQYLAGMGHLVRSTEIIRSLVPDFQVGLVIGGEPIEQFQVPDGVEVVYLPALREEAGELIALDRSVELVKVARRQRLLTLFDQFQPDCVITECFPFGKYKMAFELLPLLEQAKATQAKVVCSLRDLIMTQSLSEQGLARKQARILDQIRQFYDLVLCHSDRNLQSLEACFPAAPALPCEVFYTGYVAQSLVVSSEHQQNLQSPRIVASVGGGRYGYSLLKAICEVGPLLQQAIPHRIYAFAGPFMPETDFESLQALATPQPNITLQRFTPHLISFLDGADLSISLGGYNTTMNVLTTQVRSLILPSPSPDQVDEQWLRASRLAQLGAVSMLSPDQLSPSALAHTILQHLQTAQPSHAINLKGAENTTRRLRQLCDQTIALSR
ncbi:glycosyltransferase [Acaryochloris sp. IP29b_bin.148]|uniref:glycosyltransferase family protein n=1 Tax=Acaryochloris sp. IP29b_bin.148 TaxID=2969218 RepID=UPI00262FB3B3|nr:glycosyltransferase [Acaryochloris sp. IP29b_bin.148]